MYVYIYMYINKLWKVQLTVRFCLFFHVVKAF